MTVYRLLTIACIVSKYACLQVISQLVGGGWGSPLAQVLIPRVIVEIVSILLFLQLRSLVKTSDLPACFPVPANCNITVHIAFGQYSFTQDKANLRFLQPIPPVLTFSHHTWVTLVILRGYKTE